MKILNRFLSLILILSLLILPVAAMEPEAACAPEVYENMFSVPKTETAANETMLAVSDTVLKGRSILFFGDSLTSGYGLSLFSQSWNGMLRTNYGMNVTSWSVPASTFAVSNNHGYRPGGYYEPMCRRGIPTGSYDVIYVAGGGNDWYCEIPLGTDPASRSEKNFMGALNVTLDRLREAHPKALLLCSTSWNSTGSKNGLGLTTDDYSAAMMTVCESRGIPCFRACDPVVSGFDAASKWVRQQYFLTESDYWHLNVAGHKRFLEIIAPWLQEMLTEYYIVSPFNDVLQRDWFAEAVEYAVEAGIVQGTGANSFSPHQEMTRAMMATILYRMAGSPEISGLENPFEDVKPERYYYEAVLWCHEKGIVRGVTETAFCPGDTLTREQLVTMLHRYCGKPEPEAGTELLEQFSDRGLIHSYGETALVWAVETGLIRGMGNGTVAPDAGATRAQMVQVLLNYKNNMD